MGALIGPGGRPNFIGLYEMDAATLRTRARYIMQTLRAFGTRESRPNSQVRFARRV
jgi:hypothetical protein